MRDVVLLVLGLFVVQTLLPPAARYLRATPGLRARIGNALGPRDDPPPMPVLGARAARALANLQEALPGFLTLALLHLLRPAPGGAALLGARLFLAARVAYVPAYLSGVPGLRSALWLAGVAGLALMLAALR